MQIREYIKLFFLLVTAIATSIAAYSTYRTYLDQAEQSVLTFEAFKIVGTQELLVDDTASLSLKKVASEGGFDDYELPVKISNVGKKDVEDILLHIDVEGGELIIPSDWSKGIYADNPRYFRSVTLMRPNTSVKLPNVKVRIKSTTHEVRLKWAILAKRIEPPDGVMILRF